LDQCPPAERGARVTRALGVAIASAYQTGRSTTVGPARPAAIDRAIAVLEGQE
jgi:hypothetical protein